MLLILGSLLGFSAGYGEDCVQMESSEMTVEDTKRAS